MVLVGLEKSDAVGKVEGAHGEVSEVAVVKVVKVKVVHVVPALENGCIDLGYGADGVSIR